MLRFRVLVQTFLKYVCSDPADWCVLWLLPGSYSCGGWLREGGGISFINICRFSEAQEILVPSFPSGPVVAALDCSLELNHITLSVIIWLLLSKVKQFVSTIRELNTNLHFPLVLRSMKLGTQVDWVGIRQAVLIFKSSFYKAAHKNIACPSNDKLFLCNSQ